MASPKVDYEYNGLRAFLAWACENDRMIAGCRPEAHPMRIFERAEKDSLEGKKESFTFTQLKMILKETITDCLPTFSHWSVSQVNEADSALKKAGAPTLSEMRLIFSKDLRRLERRGRLESEEEVFLVRNALDMSFIANNPRRSKRLSDLIYQFEFGDSV